MFAVTLYCQMYPVMPHSMSVELLLSLHKLSFSSCLLLLLHVLDWPWYQGSYSGWPSGKLILWDLILWASTISTVFVTHMRYTSPTLAYGLVPRHPSHTRRRGLVSQLQINPWASSSTVEEPVKWQSGVYWSNIEAKTSTSIVNFKVQVLNTSGQFVILH